MTLLTIQQQFKALAIIPKPGSVLSFLGSLYIIVHVLRDRERRAKTQLRVLMGLSACDLLNSIASFVSTWPIPADKAGPVYGAVGNDTTCKIHGFFMQFSVSSAMYNGALALCYLLTVKYGWKDHDFRRVEPFMHGFPIIFGLATATTGFVLNAYNNAVLWCWYAAPFENYQAYRWAFYYGPLWTAIIFTLYVMASIVHKVYQLEKANRRYRQAGQVEEDFTMTKTVAAQGLFYCTVFIITWIFSTVSLLVLENIHAVFSV